MLRLIAPLYAVLCYTVAKHGRCQACTEKKINTFDLLFLRRILRIALQQKITMKKVLRRTSLTTTYFTFSQCKLRWLGHVLRMVKERFPKSLLYSKLVVGKRKRCLQKLRFKDLCKRDLKSLNFLSSDEWELLANDRAKKRFILYKRQKEKIV